MWPCVCCMRELWPLDVGKILCLCLGGKEFNSGKRIKEREKKEKKEKGEKKRKKKGKWVKKSEKRGKGKNEQY